MFNKAIISLSLFMSSSSVMAAVSTAVNRTIEQGDYINPDVLKVTLITSLLFLCVFAVLILLAMKSKTVMAANVFRVSAIIVLVILLSMKYATNYHKMNYYSPTPIVQMPNK
jgi:hypothetical protein